MWGVIFQHIFSFGEWFLSIVSNKLLETMLKDHSSRPKMCWKITPLQWWPAVTSRPWSLKSSGLRNNCRSSLWRRDFSVYFQPGQAEIMLKNLSSTVMTGSYFRTLICVIFDWLSCTSFSDTSTSWSSLWRRLIFLTQLFSIDTAENVLKNLSWTQQWWSAVYIGPWEMKNMIFDLL